MNEESIASQHPNSNFTFLKNEPTTLLKLVNTYVKVQTIKNYFYVGFVHSVDPVTHSMILSIPIEERHKTLIIPGCSILDVKKEEIPNDVKPPQKKSNQPESIDNIMERKTRLISWFKKNLLPVTELDDKIIIGNVTLLHPYNITDISTDNPIVAMQIKNVMEKMPQDFEK